MGPDVGGDVLCHTGQCRLEGAEAGAAVAGGFIQVQAPVQFDLQAVAALGGPADLILSDMAANTVGHQQTDHLRTMALVEAGLQFATEVLKPGGAYVAKVLAGDKAFHGIAQMGDVGVING